MQNKTAQTTAVQKIAVTAASGNLGAAIIRAAIKLVGKENVIGLARTPSKAAHLGVEVRAGDYNERDLLEASLQGVHTLLLVSGNDDPARRIDQHRNVIEAAKKAGVSKIVSRACRAQMRIPRFPRSSKVIAKRKKT